MVMRGRGQRALWLGVLLVAALLLVAERVGAGTLDVTWNAPTTNADGTPLTDLAHYRVYIGTPCPGGGYRSAVSATPAPPSGSVVTYAATTAGSAGFTLTVNGTNFMPSSVVRWSGNALATTYVSATQLRATIAAEAVAAAGLAEVAVATPAPAVSLARDRNVGH